MSARARVLFVHDLIPLLFPELSGDGFATALRGILGSVDVARDWIICASECTRSDLCRRLPIDPARVFVTPLAADGALFHPVDDPGPIRRIRHRYGIGDRPYLLSLSTIEPRKNLAHLIRCFSRLVHDPTVDDGLRLVLAGATGWKAAGVFQAFEDEPAIRERVIFTGYVPDDDLAGLYSGADAFVYPSRYEGFGLPVLEAMRCGVPVVTTTGGALPEVVGQAALLVDPDDADGLVQAMRVARRDVALATTGRARAAGFTWAAHRRLDSRRLRFMLSRSDDAGRSTSATDAARSWAERDSRWSVMAERYAVRTGQTAAQEIDGEAVVINFETNYYYGLNRTGTAVWKLIQDGGRDRADIAGALAAAFRTSTDAVATDVDRLIDALLAEGLIQAVATAAAGARHRGRRGRVCRAAPRQTREARPVDA